MARAAADAARAVQRELEEALAELKAQEDAYNGKIKELEQKSEQGGLVSRNKAKVMCCISMMKMMMMTRK